MQRPWVEVAYNSPKDQGPGVMFFSPQTYGGEKRQNLFLRTKVEVIIYMNSVDHHLKLKADTTAIKIG